MVEQLQSWTGSERQRREQGGCRPPKHAPNTTPRYLVRAGTRVEVRRADRNNWSEYVTQQDASFERHLRYDNRHYYFREGAYELRVHRSLVRHRADTY
jgi:hypothetical protein